MSHWRPIIVELDTASLPPRPVALHWDGIRQPVADFGRRWQAADGQHLLVRVADGRVFELWEAADGWRGRLRAQPPEIV